MKAATPLNAPSRKVELTDAAGDALVSGFSDRGDMYDASSYLNQPPWETLQKNSPSLYELNRHRATAKDPERSVMDKIYAMNEDEMLEETLKGLSHAINSDVLVIKSDETRDQMLFRSLTEGNKDGALDEGMHSAIDQFQKDALIRQSRGMGGEKALRGYI